MPFAKFFIAFSIVSFFLFLCGSSSFLRANPRITRTTYLYNFFVQLICYGVNENERRYLYGSRNTRG